MAQNEKQKQRNFRVRYDRILVCFIILIVMILLMTSCISSCVKKTNHPHDTPAAGPVEDELVSEPPDGITATAAPAETVSAYQTVSRSKEDITRGSLVLANKKHPIEYDTEAIEAGTSKDISFVTIKSILDTHASPKPYTAKDWEVGLDRTAALAMDAWFSDFYKAKDNSNIRIIGGYNPSEDVNNDYYAGRTLVIGIFEESGSNYYSPYDDYAWLDEHSAEYGFIVRYPEGKDSYFDDDITTHREATFRYVGIAPATYIKENELCLEEFLEVIKNYTVDEMLNVSSGAAEYGMYYVPVGSSVGETSFSVPAEAISYEISGNNMDGFIITAALNEAAAKNKPSTPRSDDLDDEPDAGSDEELDEDPITD
ncbi:MAG: hypothetical protein K6F80_00430 [Oscillospiraceae bacterium]|nr:hypothetical protein [Oscillospiraceae bacterium]